MKKRAMLDEEARSFQYKGNLSNATHSSQNRYGLGDANGVGVGVGDAGGGGI